MQNSNKQFKLKSDEIVQIIEPMGGCIATDRIVVDGAEVGYMCREEPINDKDSGWRFFAGDEDKTYTDNLGLSGVYDLNTIANYDPSIIPYLHYPAYIQLYRVQGERRFEIVSG